MHTLTEVRPAESFDSVSTSSAARALGVPLAQLCSYLNRWREWRHANVFAAAPQQRGIGRPQHWIARDVVIMAMLVDTTGGKGAPLICREARISLAHAIQRADWGEPLVTCTCGPLDFAYEPRWDVLG